MTYKPTWFRDGAVFVSYAETVGINKDGHTLYVVDSSTGRRTTTIDDGVSADIEALVDGGKARTGRWVPDAEFTVPVPTYYDTRQNNALEELVGKKFSGVTLRTLGDLVAEGGVTARAGHGSPSQDVRGGGVPYIKVSDIRAGQVNINPTNMVPKVVAERFWKGTTSGLKAYDLITPVRASKNIGDFAMLMPGQEDLVVTKEVLILRPGPSSPVDSFYLMWALSLSSVRDQWKRLVFMQTNREDVGKRYLELVIPWPDGANAARDLSKEFRAYYEGIERVRRKFVTAVESGGDHALFLGAVVADDEDE